MELTIENYFSKEMNNKYMGFTQFKQFVPALGGCEARSVAKLKGEWVDESKTAFLVGQYLHAINEGKLDQFIARHPEIMTNKGTLRAEYIKANEAWEVVKNDNLMMAALAGAKEVIVTAEWHGIQWKIMLDSLFEESKRFCDLKYLKDFHGKVWNTSLGLYESTFEAYGYFLQASIYSKVLSISRGLPEGEYFEPLIAAVTKEDVPDKMIMSFVSEEQPLSHFIIEQLQVVEHFIDRVKAVKSGEVEPISCGVCSYCKTKKVLTGTTHYSNYKYA